MSIDETDPIKTAYIPAAQAPAYVRKMGRGRTIFLHVESDIISQLPDDEGSYRAYPLSRTVKLTKAVAERHMREAADFASRKPGPLWVRIRHSKGCLFIS